MEHLPASSPTATTAEPHWSHSWVSEPPQRIHGKSSDYKQDQL